MDVTFENGPAFTVAVAKMAAGEQIRCEGGAMLSMSAGTQIETSTQGGILKGLKRSLSGESFFMNTFTAPAGGGDIVLAPALPGDMSYIDQQGDTWLYHRDGFVACEMGIVVKCSGQGKVIFATYGALRRVDLAAGQQYVVDSGHLVAWHEAMPIQVEKVGGLKSLFFSGEGFVVTLTGPGTFFMQTRSEGAFVSWLVPYLPKNSN